MTPQGRRLLQAHRRGQLAVFGLVARELHRLWPTLNLDNDVVWTAAVTAVVSRGFRQSATLSAAFTRQLRLAEVGSGFDPVIPQADFDRIERRLAGAGPGVVRANLAKGVGYTQAARLGAYWSTATATTLALEGGRETVLRTGRADRQVRRFHRYAAGNACSFCGMLASSSSGQFSEDFDGFHDGCRCQLVPVYSDRQALPPNSERFRELWDEAGGDRKQFRRLVEA